MFGEIIGQRDATLLHLFAILIESRLCWASFLFSLDTLLFCVISPLLDVMPRGGSEILRRGSRSTLFRIYTSMPLLFFMVPLRFSFIFLFVRDSELYQFHLKEVCFNSKCRIAIDH